MTISLEPCAPRLDKGWARATNCALFLLRKPDRCFFYWGGHQIFAITWLEFYQHFQWETVKNYGTVGEAIYILFLDVEPQSKLKGLLPFWQLIKISNIRKNALKAILDILILMCFKSWAQKNKWYQADDVSTLIEIDWLILWHYGKATVEKSLHICVWKTWAWVSSRLENVKWLGEACAIFWQVSNHPNRILDFFPRQYTIFLDFLFVFFKRPAQILPQGKKINGSKGCTVFARVTQKGWWQTDRWRKVTVFLGLRRRGHRRPRHTECVLYAPLVAWWWPGCTRAR